MIASTGRLSTKRPATLREWTIVYRVRFQPGMHSGGFSDVQPVTGQPRLLEQVVDNIPREIHQVVDRRFHCRSRDAAMIPPGTDSVMELSGVRSCPSNAMLFAVGLLSARDAQPADWLPVLGAAPASHRGLPETATPESLGSRRQEAQTPEQSLPGRPYSHFMSAGTLGSPRVFKGYDSCHGGKDFDGAPYALHV